MNYFTYILQEFCLDAKQRCICFRNFQKTYFPKCLSITAYDSNARVLPHGLWNERTYKRDSTKKY